MDLIQTLREEHELILRVLDSFEAALGAAPEPDGTAAETFGPFLEFFGGFADDCHHQKEEGYLFPALERAGLPSNGGPVAVMLQEHDQGRAHLKAVAEAIEAVDGGDGGALAVIAGEGAGFISMLRNHITKENNVLFMMASEMIAGDAAAALSAEVTKAVAEPGYIELSTRTRAIGERLTAEYADAASA